MKIVLQSLTANVIIKEIRQVFNFSTWNLKAAK